MTLINLSGLDFYFFNKRMAFFAKDRHLAKSIALWLLTGISYARYLEYPLVVRKLQVEQGMHLLDIGSSSQSFPMLLAAKGCLVTATNIDPVVHNLSAIARRMGVANNLRAELADGRSLPFEEASFERVTSVSVVEHIDGRGDSEVLSEIGRVLKPRGRAVVTAPFGQRFMDTDLTRPYFMRVYDQEALISRLVIPSSLRLETIDCFGDRLAGFENVWSRLTAALHPFGDWTTPFVASILLSTLPATRIRGIGGACLTLVKD